VYEFTHDLTCGIYGIQHRPRRAFFAFGLDSGPPCLVQSVRVQQSRTTTNGSSSNMLNTLEQTE
jgi:hypothetical protein